MRKKQQINGLNGKLLLCKELLSGKSNGLDHNLESSFLVAQEIAT